tara:strand:+ start:490 stop:675 length:186 start_codon:yes stop_codon:yes gene_type:complete
MTRDERHPRVKMTNALEHLEDACNLLLSCKNNGDITERSYKKLSNEIWELEYQIKYLLGEE